MNNSNHEDQNLSSLNPVEIFNVLLNNVTEGTEKTVATTETKTVATKKYDEDSFVSKMLNGVDARDRLDEDAETYNGVPLAYFDAIGNGYDKEGNTIFSVLGDTFLQEEAVNLEKLEIKNGVNQVLAEELPKIMPASIDKNWEAYAGNVNRSTIGYQSASVLLAASTVQYAIPRATMRSLDTNNSGALNAVVIGGSGSGKSHILKPIIHMTTAIKAAVKYTDSLYVDLISVWNELLVALGDKETDESIQTVIVECLKKLKYDRLVKSHPRLALLPWKGKNTDKKVSFYTPVAYPTKMTYERVVADSVHNSNAKSGILRVVHAARKISEILNGNAETVTMVCDLDNALQAIDANQRGLASCHFGLQMDEINAYIKLILESGKASEACSQNELTRHGFGAKGDMDNTAGESSETEFSLGMSGCTTNKNTIALFDKYKDFIDTGWSGRMTLVNVVRGGTNNPEYQPIVSSDDEYELNYRYGIAGLLLTAFPHRYSAGFYTATLDQNKRLYRAVEEARVRFQGEELEPNINRFVQSHSALAVHTAIYFTLMEDVDKLMPTIQSWKDENPYTGEVVELSLARYIELNGSEDAAWWAKTATAGAFITMATDHFGASVKDCIAPKEITDEIFDASLEIINSSLMTVKNTLEMIDRSNIVKKHAQNRAENALRNEGDETIAQVDAERLLTLVCKTVGATPDATPNDVARKIKDSSVSKTMFGLAPDQKTKRQQASDGIKRTIKKLVQLGIINETIVPAGTKTKAVITISKVLTPEEITATAKTMIK